MKEKKLTGGGENEKQLFTLEEQRWQKLDEVVRRIQRVWRANRGKAYYEKLKYTASDIVVGKKQRNAMSIWRPYRGDYIHARHSALAKGVRREFGNLPPFFYPSVPLFLFPNHSSFPFPFPLLPSFQVKKEFYSLPKLEKSIQNSRRKREYS